MNIHIYLSPASPVVCDISQLKLAIADKLEDAIVIVTVDDGLLEDSCFIDGDCDPQDLQEIHFILSSLSASRCEKNLAVV